MEVTINGITFKLSKGNFGRESLYEKLPKGNYKLLGQVWQDTDDRWRCSWAETRGICHLVKRKFFNTKTETIFYLREFWQDIERDCAE